MALLDRFRAQPRQKHPDPAVRLAFVQEIPIDERDLLVEIAREDTDARVRRAAVGKLMDPAALGGVARQDDDQDVRAEASSMLRDIAVEAFEGVGEPESLAAVAALAEMADARALAIVAKTAPREVTALQALAAVGDAHALGSIARHAEQEATRRAAFERLEDHGEILAVALNSEFRDPAAAAVDRITDRAELEQIAARAKSKSAVKRARTVLRELDEQAARIREEQERAAVAAAAQAAAARAADAERRAAEQDQEQAEAARAAEADRLRAEQEAAARRREEEAAQAAAAHARRNAEEEAARRDAERRVARLAELADEAARAAGLEDLATARRQFTVIRREWADVAGGITPDAGVAARYGEADAAFAARETAAREHDQRTRREALGRLQQLASRVEPLAARADLTLKAAERALRDVRAALGHVPPMPSRQDYEEIVKRLKAAQTALTPKVQELRDIAGWQRWANVGIQEQLCEKMEALKALADAEEIARQVHELQQQWRQAADVPRAQGEALWRRFKAAHDEVWTRCEAHYAEQNAARADNLAKKVALCERAEALADSTAWIQTAEEIKRLQAEWKTIGPVTRGQEKAIWERFRSACDRFFTRRHADLVERKAVWSANAGRKEALCAEAEALSESSDWEAAAAAIKRLQAEWRAVGSVKKSRSEALWQRFRGACDRFFTRYAQRHDIVRAERVAAREAICQELEELAAPSGDGPEVAEPPADLLGRVRSSRSRWQQELAARGVDRERAAALDERFAAAFAAVIGRWPSVFGGTDLDPAANRKRMEAIVRRMEELATSLAGPVAAADATLSPTTRLAAMLKEALAANTIGGKVEDDHRLRAAAEDVRQAQASWSRIGPVPDAERRALADRFQRAIRTIAARQEGRKAGFQEGKAGR